MTLPVRRFLLYPGPERQRDPHRAAIDVEADIDGIGVAVAMATRVPSICSAILATPAIGCMESSYIKPAYRPPSFRQLRVAWQAPVMDWLRIRLLSHEEALRRHFEGKPPMRVALECGTHSHGSAGCWSSWAIR